MVWDFASGANSTPNAVAATSKNSRGLRFETTEWELEELEKSIKTGLTPLLSHHRR